jgi:FkbH-like protein
MPASDARPRQIKCVVWDLDDTLWDGVLLEGGAARPVPACLHAIRTLDERGILHSIASRNDPDAALGRLRELGLDDYFLHPQIGWNAKSESIRAVARELNLGLDAFAFVDDQAFERAEVASALPDVLCLDPKDVGAMLEMPELSPRHVSAEARARRRMYQGDLLRRRAEESHAGASEEFLRSIDMRLRIWPASEADLRRAEELTLRTHQLNTTGYAYSYEELDQLRASPDHLVLLAALEDRFGSYGTIGLAVIERDVAVWTLKLLLMSCRVMSRGIGTILLSHVMQRAKTAGCTLRAHFVRGDRNRVMLVALKFVGFRVHEQAGALTIYASDLAAIPPIPDYVALDVGEAARSS